MQNHPTNNTPQADDDMTSYSIETPEAISIEDRNRRKIIKKIAAGTAALAGCSVLPDKWTSPLLEFGSLPAHATTSTLIGELIQKYEDIKAEREKEKQAEQEEKQQAASSGNEPSEQQESTEPSEPAGEVIKIHWEGDPNETSESRDRTWWTKIHGGSYEHWHRKFPLPRWIDDRPRRLEFTFSDGATFSVSDSTKMYMKPTGPKYKPEEHGERDPRKQHPKIGAERDATPTWVKLKVV